jgi:hypothetical protein
MYRDNEVASHRSRYIYRDSERCVTSSSKYRQTIESVNAHFKAPFTHCGYGIFNPGLFINHHFIKPQSLAALVGSSQKRY